MLRKGKSVLQRYESAIEFEWLETNGLGGWSSSSIIGCNTRRYHALLMAATIPPVERISLVSKLDETLIINGERFELATNDYGDIIHPKGHEFLVQFTKEYFPAFEYEAGGVSIRKTISMIDQENTVVISYEVLKAERPFMMELLPLLSVRPYHNLGHANDEIINNSSFEKHVFSTTLYKDTPAIFIKVPNGQFHENAGWFYHFNYAIEKNRGLDYVEDLFAPGKFSVEMKQGVGIEIILSTENPALKNGEELVKVELARRKMLLNGQPAQELTQQLLLAADQFIVQRNHDLKTVIAGYHWFTDWGRDTMIALPGLCLTTGRFDDAKKILLAFANSVDKGMLPNRFPDSNERAEYNNADGTLWFFIAIYHYLNATNDLKFVLGDLLPVLTGIINWHYKGTRYNIHVDEDGLLYAGEKGQQLTWMDAKVEGWVVTPRMGYPVEIQALWFNALHIYALLLARDGQQHAASEIVLSADKVKECFRKRFWYAEGNYLYDNIDENNVADKSLRPNQLFAISLPFPLLHDEDARLVFKVVKEKLFTPVGLRSLAASDTNYIPTYTGNTLQRDSCYHEGTVWSWLLGPYIDAIMLTNSSDPNYVLQTHKEEARTVIDQFQFHLNEACIGSVSEIFDAEPPHHPRGCIAQAWSVGELLRVIKKYELFPELPDDPMKN